MNFRELWVRWIVTPNSDEYFNWVVKPSPQSSKQENSMFPTKRSPGDGMSRVAYTTPKESCSKKSSVYIVKGSNFRPTGKKIRKATKSKLLKPTTITSRIYWIPQQTLTFPPWVSVSSPLSSQWKRTMDNVGISPLKENGEGEAVHDSRKKADLLLEEFKSVFTQEDL